MYKITKKENTDWAQFKSLRCVTHIYYSYFGVDALYLNNFVDLKTHEQPRKKKFMIKRQPINHSQNFILTSKQQLGGGGRGVIPKFRQDQNLE